MRVSFDVAQGLIQCPRCAADGSLSRPSGIMDSAGRLFDGLVECGACGGSAFRVRNGKWLACDGGPDDDPEPPAGIAARRSAISERLVPATAADVTLVGSWSSGLSDGTWLSGGDECSAAASCAAEWASALLLRHPVGGPVSLLINDDVVGVADTHQASGSAWIEVPFPGPTAGTELAVHARGPHAIGFGGFVLYTDRVDGRYVSAPAFNHGNAYSPYIEPKLQALDPSATILEVGGGDRRRRNPRHINVEYAPFRGADLVADVHRLPFLADSFDAVVSQAVFEHLAQPFEAADELMRVLKPGGLMVCEVAFLQPLHGVPFHYFNMTLDGVSELFPDLRDTTREWFGSLSDTVEWMLGAVGASGRVEQRTIEAILEGLRQVDARMSPEEYLPVASGVVLTGRKAAPR